MATTNRDFRVKNGLIVEGTTATVNGNSVLTSASSIDALSDVVITTPTTNQVLSYNGTNWINSSSGGGISSVTSGTGITVTNGTGPSVTVAVDTTVVATTNNTLTMSNKTLTSPVISTISNTGTLTLPTSTDTLIGRATTDTLTNKTISGSNNTISNIGNSSLTNSSITVNGSAISLGGSATITAASPNALTIGTGLSGTSYNGSSAVTIAIDSTVATLSGTQTLTNKTLTDSTTFFQDETDNSKKLQFQLSGITTATTRTLTVQNASGTIALTSNNLGAFASTTSSQLAGVISDETGSGALVFGTTPTLSQPVINVPRWGYTTTATAAGTTTLTATSSHIQIFTGSSIQTVVMPVTSTLATGQSWEIENNSTGTLTVNSSGGNLIVSINPGHSYALTCIGTTLTTAADWNAEWNGSSTITGTGAAVMATSPTLTTPNIGVATGTSFNSITGLSSTTPIVNGTAAVGTGTTAARADHVHPTDTTRAPLASPTFTGTVTVPTPTNATDAATKQYVDDVAQGLHIHPSVVTATTSDLTATYSNGSSGVGATLTNSGTQAALVIDGVTVVVNDRVLIKNQSSALQNGIYTVTNVGSVSTNWVLTRATDMDQSVEVDGGDFVFVTGGTVNDNTGWVQTETNVTVGTNNISFTQFSGAGTYTAGNGLTLTGNTFSINTGITADLSTAQTLTNKTIALGSNTVSGTISQFNTALTDADFATLAGTETLTNKTVNLSNNTLTGTISQFNTALSDGDFATLAGSETLSNKTLTAPRFASAGEIDDANGNELIKFSATVASAVNEITVTNTATGGSPSISATGDDTNISLNLVAKGTGTVQAGGVPVVTTTGSQTLTNKTLTSPVISTISNTGTLTLPTSTDTLVGRATTDTLTNKSIALGSNTVTGTISEFNTALTDADFATLAGSETLTNKTISGANNTLSNIGNSSLTNSSVTVNGTAISLGGSATITAANPNALTIGTGLSGTSYNGSSAVTIAIDSTVATLTGAQTLTNKTLGSGTTLSANLAAGTNKITGLGDPTAAQDAATKAYVDSVAQGLDIKASVRVATTSAGTLSTSFANGSVVDGVTLATGDRILIKNQATTSENGIYTVNASGAPTRATDMDVASEFPGAFAFVEEGTSNADTGWVCTTNAPVTVGTTNITFSQFSGAGTYTAGNGLTLSGSQFVINTSITADLSTAQTFTNKSIALGSNTITGTISQFNTALTDADFATLAGTETLTNKTINGANNILTVRIANDVSGLGTGVATALAVNTGTAGAFVVNGGALGTPSSGTLTNATGLPVTSGISGLGTGIATFLATPSSANLASAVTDETGSGALVFATSPTLTTPNIGVATGTSFNSITALSSTTPSANSTASIGTSTTVARADHVHPISALTIGTGLSGSSYNGSSAVTIAIDSTVATLTGTQTLTNKTLGSGTTLSANLAAGTNKITGLGDPTAAQDAATKAYVDSVAQGLDIKASVRAATTSAGTLSSSFANGSVVDGVTLATGDRILIKNQATTSENGIYTVNASGAPTRATDMDIASEFPGAFTFVEEGTSNADTGWVCTTNAPVTVGTTNITFSQFSGAGTYTAGTGLTLTGSQFSLTTPVSVANGGTGITSFGTGIATWLGTPSSANLAAAVTDETGSGALVFATSPTLVTPNIGVATGTSFNSITGLSSTTPAALGTAAVGTGTTVARADHVHPTATTVVNTVTGTNSAELVRGNMADNDHFRILVGGTGSNAGFAEIATADDGTEPIYVRQYTGVFSSLTRTATLLDGSGNTTFPGTVTGTSFNSITGLSSTTPVANGTATVGTATTTARADHVHPISALTIGTGLSGTSYNGSSAVTIAIDSTVATTSGTQTLTNKTIKETSTTTINANTATTVDTIALNSFTSVQYVVSIKQGTKIRTSTLNVQTDGTSVDFVEYGTIQTGGNMTGFAINATTSSTNAVLNITITDAATTNATVKIFKVVM